MDETGKAQQDSPLKTGLTSEGKEGITSKPKPKTYTEEELSRALEKVKSDTLAEAGRRYKPIEDENATLKSQLATNQRLISRTEERIEQLNQQIAELSKDDPDKIRLVQKLRELEGLENKLKDEIKTERARLDADIQSHQESVDRANKFEFEYNCTEIAEGYVNGDSDKLQSLCQKLNAVSKEQIRSVADSIFSKKVEEKPEVPEIIPDTGMTSGGGGMPTNEQLQNMTPEQYAEWAAKRYK